MVKHEKSIYDELSDERKRLQETEIGRAHV